ncbi:MAG: alpha/beta hydrolase family protein [Promethearchaeota archaeon]
MVIYYYTNAVQVADQARSDTFIKLERYIASDGVELKFLILASPEDALKTDHSIPLVICSHGMNADFWFMKDFYYTLTKLGYAVVAPEFRGHRSNSAPTTYGNKEPYDILEIVDYVEHNYEFINSTNIGIVGHSMGGLFSAGAYIFESLGKKRFKTFVDLSGAVNATRAVEHFLTDPTMLGELQFLANMTKKNPINYVNSTFPRNIYIIHGEYDNIVGKECSLDFYNALNPYGNRTDVKFELISTSNHEIYQVSNVKEKLIAWLDKYLKNQTTDPSSITIYKFVYDEKYGTRFQMFLLIDCFFIMVLFGCTTYLIKPKVYVTELPDFLLNGLDNPRKTIIKRNKFIHKFILILSYFSLNGIVLLILEFFPTYATNDMFFTGFLSTIYVVILYYLGSPADKRNLYRWINPKVSIIWLIAIIGSLTFYSILPTIDYIEDRIILPGIRITWYVPTLTAAIALQIISNMLFIRFLFVWEKRINEIALFEASINGLFVGASTFVLLSRNLPAVLILPMFNFTFYVAPLFGLLYGIGFFLFTLLTRVIYLLTKTITTGAILCGLIISMSIGMSTLTFIV